MMSAPHPGDFLEVMNRRSELLRLLGDGPKTKRQLEGLLDVSRSTIDRGIRELAEKELVERTAEGYRQTLPGRLALRDYQRFTRRVAGLCAGATLLTDLPPDVDVDPAFLEGADVVESRRASPHRPIEELYCYVESAERIRGFAPAVHPQQVETYRRRITEAGMAADIVLTDDAVERMLAVYDAEFQAGLSSDHVTFYRTDRPLDYSLTIADLPEKTVAGLMVYGSGGIRGCIINDARPGVEWAERRFRATRDRATEIDSG